MTVDVSSDDIATELGRTLTAAETAQANLWIGDAERLIDTRLTVADLDADTVAMVVRLAVAKRIREAATSDASSTTVSVDDGSVTRRFGEFSRAGDGAWWFLPEWWSWLTPDVAAMSSVRPGFEPDVPDLSTLNWA